MAKTPSPDGAAPESGRSSTRRDLVESQIVAEATRLFAERGFSGTSLKDIADATGLTRPAIYHYVRNKDELLAKLVAELAQGPVLALREINDTADAEPLDRLRHMAQVVAGQQAAEPSRFQLLIRSEADLSDDLAGPYLQGRREVLAEFVRVIEDGVRAGQMRPVDPRIAALSILGQCNWVAWWQPPGASAEEAARVADALADLAVASVISSGADAAVRDSPAGALAQVRRDLDLLEQAIGRADQS